MDRYYSDLVFLLGDGKASEAAAAYRMDYRTFYELLDAARRHQKPA